MASDNESANDFHRVMAAHRANWDAWDWLRAATEAGWTDPGRTEPLEKTVERAKQFLADNGGL